MLVCDVCACVMMVDAPNVNVCAVLMRACGGGKGVRHASAVCGWYHAEVERGIRRR